MKRNGLRMMESPVQGQLARRVRWGGCGNVHAERDATRRVLTQSLQEHRDAYRVAGTSINYYSQANQLPEIKDIREEYKDIHNQVLQDVLRRVKKAFDTFFRRVKNGETPGYPRFQGRDRYDSFTYPQGGYSLTHDDRVCFSKIGSVLFASNARKQNPRYTSQVCSGCGTVRKKELSERWHSCECGTELDRDHNAAFNILRLGSSQQASYPVAAPAFTHGVLHEDIIAQEIALCEI